MRAVIFSAAALFFAAARAQQYANPFCGNSTSRDTVTVTLECAPGAVR